MTIEQQATELVGKFIPYANWKGGCQHWQQVKEYIQTKL